MICVEICVGSSCCIKGSEEIIRLFRRIESDEFGQVICQTCADARALSQQNGGQG